MSRFFVSLLLVAMSILTIAPVASATVTDAQFSALTRQVNGLRLQNQRLEAQVTELRAQVEELETATSPIVATWIEKLELFSKHLNVYDQGTENIGDDKISIEPATLGAWKITSFTSSTAHLSVSEDVRVLKSSLFDAPQPNTAVLIDKGGIRVEGGVVSDHFMFRGAGSKVYVDLISVLLPIRDILEDLGTDFENATLNSAPWSFNNWINTVLGVWTDDEPCQPGYSTCNDGNPCSFDWCSPETYTCQHQQLQECSGQ